MHTHTSPALQAAAKHREQVKQRKKANQEKSAQVQKVCYCQSSGVAQRPPMSDLASFQEAARLPAAATVMQPSTVCVCLPPMQITNAATVKKMMKSKKQRKLLRTADTN
jgi:hypothetical protein